MLQDTQLAFRPHRPLTAAGRGWLVALADPLGRAPRPAKSLDFGDLDNLFAAAELHGVLPAVVRGVRSLSERSGQRMTAAASYALAAARQQVMMRAGVGMLLEHYRSRVTTAFRDAGVRGTVVKGALAASRLYPEAALRTFTDIDVLVDSRHRARTADAMSALGFTLTSFPDREGRDYEEDKWMLPGERDVLVEVHANLVHSPKLRGAMSVRYEDVLESGDGDCSGATALLLVAGAHAAIGHQFDRLQHLVDILQAVRGAAGPIDAARLRRVAESSGVLGPLVTSIELAGRTFRDPLCAELASELNSGQFQRWYGLLITPELVITAQSSDRVRGSWRRNLYRHCLKLGSRRQTPAAGQLAAPVMS